MLLSGVLFAVILAGCWLAWLITRPRRGVIRPSAGITAGLRALPAHTYAYSPPDRAAAEASFARHPAGRSRKTSVNGWTQPKGPDDDPEFLRVLARRIHGTPGDAAE